VGRYFGREPRYTREEAEAQARQAIEAAVSRGRPPDEEWKPLAARTGEINRELATRPSVEVIVQRPARRAEPDGTGAPRVVRQILKPAVPEPEVASASEPAASPRPRPAVKAAPAPAARPRPRPAAKAATAPAARSTRTAAVAPAAAPVKRARAAAAPPPGKAPVKRATRASAPAVTTPAKRPARVPAPPAASTARRSATKKRPG
jgi:hypothetical protein